MNDKTSQAIAARGSALPEDVLLRLASISRIRRSTAETVVTLSQHLYGHFD